MSRKHFSGLLVAVIIVVIAIALLVPRQTVREEATDSGLLLQDLSASVNDVDLLEVVAAGNQTVATLTRGEQAWTVRELSGYPADWDKVRDVLAGLSEASIVEPKTENPDYYARLGVEDIAGEEAGGVLVRLGAGEQQWAVIIGNEADGRGGRYARVEGQSRSALSDFEADVPDAVTGWVDDRIIDLAQDDVAEVSIEHPDGESVRVHKVSADEADFVLDGIPEGREIASSWAVNSLGGALGTLDLDAVKPETDIDWSGATRTRLLTFSGLVMTVDSVTQDDERWVRLEASAPFESEATAADAEAPETPIEGASARADEINARVAGWAYAIPAYKHDTLVKRLEDLLKQPEDAGSTGS